MIDHVLALPEGYRLQEYTICGTLGFGGFGITYKAHDNHLDKFVAIKEYLPSELAVRIDGSTVSARSDQDREGFEWGRERFLAEARTVARFDHPNIIRIYRFFEENGTGYIVMEFIDGRPLSKVLEHEGTLEESQIRAWLWPVLEGLQVVHEKNFLHRDIKPHNIMIRHDGSPVLLDFGAARVAVSGQTRSLTSILTPGFAPLEQYQTRGHQGPWTDIYALGAVVYCCMAGRKPTDALDRVTDDTLEPPDSDSKYPYSPALVNGVMAALTVRENERPQDIDRWMAILSDDGGGATRVLPPQAPDPGPGGRTPVPAHSGETAGRTGKRGPRKWALVSVPLLLVLAAAGYWVLQNRPETADVGPETEVSGVDREPVPMPETAMPQTAVPESTVPDDSVGATPMPETTAPEAQAPETMVQEEAAASDEGITAAAKPVAESRRPVAESRRPAQGAPSLVIITGCDDRNPLAQVTPRYPQEAASRGVDGRVTLAFTVDTEGRVVDPKVRSAEPAGLFESAALEAIKEFRYRPNTIGGQLHPCLGSQDLRFLPEGPGG